MADSIENQHMIKRLTTQSSDFWPQLEQLLAWESVSDAAVVKAVEGILADVRQRGDAAVIEYTNRFDRVQVRDMKELEIPAARLQQALKSIPAETRSALETAGKRLQSYHRHQKQEPGS